MIGDSYEADIKGALDYGLEAIHLITNGDTFQIVKLSNLMSL